MEYICVDRGSDRCPCVLMEAGQCYTCDMIKTGKCQCGSLWQGVCPYTEYLQRNKKAALPSSPREVLLYGIKSYSPTLTILTLETTLAYGIKCREMGAFLMIKWKDWFIPISVLSVDLDYENQKGHVELAVNAVGPKTIGLLKSAVVGMDMVVKGPFYSGVIGKERYNRNVKSIVIAKGLSVMPLINVKETLSKTELQVKLDTSKLPETFLRDYLANLDYEKVYLQNQLFDVAESFKEEYGYAYGLENQKPNAFLMASPYYVEKFISLTGMAKGDLIIPNHSNMCCGEGYCGSCSYNDEDGTTVRGCKCLDA